MRINTLPNAIGIMTVIILFMTPLLQTTGCSTARPSKKHQIQMLYKGEIRPQEDIAIVITSMKYNPPGHAPQIKLRIINIDGIEITEMITEVTPGVHKFRIQCERKRLSYSIGKNTYQTTKERTGHIIRTIDAKAGYIYFPIGSREKDNNKCSPIIVEEYFRDLDTNKWGEMVKTYNKMKNEGIYAH